MTHPWMCARECVAHKAQMHADTAYAAPTRRSTGERSSYSAVKWWGNRATASAADEQRGLQPQEPGCAIPHLVHDPRSISTAPSCGAAEANSGQRLCTRPGMHATHALHSDAHTPRRPMHP